MAKSQGGDAFRWAHTIEEKGQEYHLYASNLHSKDRADEVAREVEVEGYTTKVVRPWGGFKLVYLVYTYPRHPSTLDQY